MANEQNYEKVGLSRRQIVINNFLGGISWGLGTTVGLSIFLGVVGIIFSRIDLVPIIGSWLSQILNSVNLKNPSLLR